MARGLGKGLDAIFNKAEIGKEEVIQEIKISECRPNPYQPRKIFNTEAIEELKQSIIEHGIITAIDC